jgi:hypothetical protein
VLCCVVQKARVGLPCFGPSEAMYAYTGAGENKEKGERQVVEQWEVVGSGCAHDMQQVEGACTRR